MPSPDEVADFALRLAGEAAESLESFVDGDISLVFEARMALLERREPSVDTEAKRWPGGASRWSEHQAALDLLMGLARSPSEEEQVELDDR